MSIRATHAEGTYTSQRTSHNLRLLFWKKGIPREVTKLPALPEGHCSPCQLSEMVAKVSGVLSEASLIFQPYRKRERINHLHRLQTFQAAKTYVIKKEGKYFIKVSCSNRPPCWDLQHEATEPCTGASASKQPLAKLRKAPIRKLAKLIFWNVSNLSEPDFRRPGTPQGVTLVTKEKHPMESKGFNHRTLKFSSTSDLLALIRMFSCSSVQMTHVALHRAKQNATLLDKSTSNPSRQKFKTETNHECKAT